MVSAPADDVSPEEYPPGIPERSQRYDPSSAAGSWWWFHLFSKESGPGVPGFGSPLKGDEPAWLPMQQGLLATRACIPLPGFATLSRRTQTCFADIGKAKGATLRVNSFVRIFRVAMTLSFGHVGRMKCPWLSVWVCRGKALSVSKGRRRVCGKILFPFRHFLIYKSRLSILSGKKSVQIAKPIYSDSRNPGQARP